MYLSVTFLSGIIYLFILTNFNTGTASVMSYTTGLIRELNAYLLGSEADLIYLLSLYLLFNSLCCFSFKTILQDFQFIYFVAVLF